MRKVVYYLTASLDGYIARPDGSVDWMPEPTAEDFGFAEFLQTIDTVVQGRKTYEQVLTFGEYPYAGKENFVFSTTMKNAKHAEVISVSPREFVKRRRQRKGKDIWLVGGAKLASHFFDENAIDDLVVFVQPVVLGEGISLTKALENDVPLTLASSRCFRGGQVRLDYRVKRKVGA
jgi:dihydrofolate reductase